MSSDYTSDNAACVRVRVRVLVRTRTRMRMRVRVRSCTSAHLHARTPSRHVCPRFPHFPHLGGHTAVSLRNVLTRSLCIGSHSVDHKMEPPFGRITYYVHS
jgi:hypothetical protein